MRKVQFRGLRNEKDAEFIFINEHFFRKRNDENGLFEQTLIRSKQTMYIGVYFFYNHTKVFRIF